MEKTLYIIRHGETELNRRGIVQGRGMDSDLNETGWKQAEAFHRHYQHVPFDKIYTSTLKRTHQTVSKFIDAGIPWVQYPGLDELAWGVLEGQESSMEVRSLFSGMLHRWSLGHVHEKFEQGESPLEVRERQLQVLERLIEKNEDQTILICMHGRAMRLFLCLLFDEPIHEMEKYPHMNTSLYKVGYDGSRFHMLEFNNLEHLTEL